jgi:hypothetical protein
MSKQRLETLTWVLIYGGLLVLCLGWFASGEGQGWGTATMIGGGAVAAIGAVLILVRSRMT